jgi:prevent-host-death family protein
MDGSVSKSKFKARALEYFREVERTGQALIVTDRGRPVLKIVPYREDPAESLRDLKDSVVRYEAPFEPVGVDDWESAT